MVLSGTLYCTGNVSHRQSVWEEMKKLGVVTVFPEQGSDSTLLKGDPFRRAALPAVRSTFTSQSAPYIKASLPTS
ncbi:hypothetical protein GOODEAATRI_022419 [Goodea atripinnis]|uniref:Uncharacterized protein n=1 Tax=Goodea atripinnis TaxID=208336 RepID=A0ABV0N3I3_9TELE